MQTSVLETYNQLTVQDQEKVTTFIEATEKVC